MGTSFLSLVSRINETYEATCSLHTAYLGDAMHDESSTTTKRPSSAHIWPTTMVLIGWWLLPLKGCFTVDLAGAGDSHDWTGKLDFTDIWHRGGASKLYSTFFVLYCGCNLLQEKLVDFVAWPFIFSAVL